MDNRYSPLKSIPNFRDVGLFVNESTETKRLKTGLLFRGARPDECTIQDRERLVNDWRLRSIIDLRTKTEHVEQAQKRTAHIRKSEAVPQSNDDVAEPLKIPGVEYYEINFNGSAYSRMLISTLSWGQFFRLIGLMATGYRIDAIRILAPAINEKGLVGLAIDSLEVCTNEVKQVFDVLAEEKNWPVLIHCTQGKDRTGLNVMLILFLLGIDIDSVEKDYLLSQKELEGPEKEERMKEIKSIGLSEQFAACPPNLAREVYRHIESKYGSVERYLEHVGVTKAMQERIKEILRADSGEEGSRPSSLRR